VRSANAIDSAASEAPMAMTTEAMNSAGSYWIGGEVSIAAMPV
jgi:hypothetical protein